MLLKFETEQEWKTARAQDVTSTEIAALFGLSPYKSRLRLWHEKKGDIDSDFEESDHTRWGRRLQLAIGKGIADDEGWSARDLSLFYFRHDELPLGASMDFLVGCVERGTGIMEVKHTTEFSEENGWFKDRAPLEYEFQIQTQLHLAAREKQDIQFGVIAALDGKKRTRTYIRMYDAALGQKIEQEVGEFFASIELDEPPAPDYAVDADLIAQLQGPIEIGRTVSLTGNNKAHDLLSSYMKLGDDIAFAMQAVPAIQAEREKKKSELLHLIGTAEQAIIGDYRISAREVEVEDRLVNGYKFRRFDIKKLRKGKSK